MRTGRPKKPLQLNMEDKTQLQRMAGRATGEQRLAFRAQIVLSCADGLSNKDVAQQLRTSGATVCKWRERFRVNRLAGLVDEPRPGTPRTISDEKVIEVVRRTLDTKPKAATHWSTRSMAATAGLSQRAIVRIWHAFGLQPHRTETFKLSTDPFFAEKVRDIVGLYLNPPDKAMVLCIDEKSQVQALDRTQLLFPLRPGLPARQTHDYHRHGTTSLFGALDTATGKVIAQCHRRHRHQEFIKFLNKVDANVPTDDELEIHLVMDNYQTHKTPQVKRWFLRHPRYHVHFTPTSASWMNLIERFFAEITQKRIRRGTFKSVTHLEAAIREYLNHHNENPKPFVWTADADLIFSKIERYCNVISDSGH